eukprot:Partr_v1_DN26823_c1_g1_i1_m40947 putative golgi to ER traffic protein 4 homolog
MTSTTTGTSKVLEKLKQSVAAGDFYEAHQMYRSVHRRLSKQKKYDEARQLVQDGAIQFFAAKEYGSAVDLSLLLLDTFNNSEVPVDTDNAATLLSLLVQFPSNHPSKQDFVSGIVRWSAKYGTVATGEPSIHHEIAQMYQREKSFDKAQKHYLLGVFPQSPQALAQVSLDASNGQIDHAVATLSVSILKYLSIAEKIEYAQACLDHFTSIASDAGLTALSTENISGSDEIVVYAQPLINMCTYLIMACRKRAPRMYTLLKQRYEQTLSAVAPDAVVDLEKVGAVQFGISNQRPGQVNFGDLLGSLFGGGGASNTPRAPITDYSLD